jgi:DNA-binding NtrC family response regulator
MTKQPIAVLAVDDEETLLHTLTRILQQNGFYVNTAEDGRVAMSMLETLPFDIVLLDVMMPNATGIDVLKFIKDQHLDAEVIMVTAVQDVHTAVECMSLGAFYYITKPYIAAELLALIERAWERKRLLNQNRALKRQIAHLALPASMGGSNKKLLEMLDLALRAAPTDSPVLIHGASGTGKEVVANFVHINSLRNEMPFLALDSSSHAEIPLERELFGYEKDAFADAGKGRQGLLEMANGGTLLLDQVGDMPLTLQPRLLRFLQTGEFCRVGGSKVLKSDVRIISATTRDLQREVAAGRFLEELLLRLNQIALDVPSLRDRKQDIPVLVEQFLKDQAGTRQPKQLDEKALEVLMAYDWPGNVRELENVIQRAAILSDGDMIGVEHLAIDHRSRVQRKARTPQRRPKARTKGIPSPHALTKDRLKKVLQEAMWDERRAAKILSVDVQRVMRKIKAYRLRKPR